MKLKITFKSATSVVVEDIDCQTLTMKLGKAYGSNGAADLQWYLLPGCNTMLNIREIVSIEPYQNTL